MGRVRGEDDARQVTVSRSSLCLPDYETGVIVHQGHHAFEEQIRRHYATAESTASERTVELKARLRMANTFDFWLLLMEGMTSIMDAQYGFVAKRILTDDENSAVEMPPLGEPGSCLMGLAFYFNDGKGQTGMFRDYKYLAYGAPCAHMRHDKVFLIPENLNLFVPDNVNNFPFPTDAYLGIPLFAEGKCIAHFGLMWTREANQRRQLSWAFVELFLHSLEDLVLQRILDGESFAKSAPDQPKISKVIPQDAVDNAKQSLRPYARSLSHELRTPMQGVVGLLDVMHSTVQDAVNDDKTDRKVKSVFRTLRENIEVVQDSSRRAVEAADNVVHAYDLNMEIPKTPVASITEAQQAEDVRQCIADPDVSKDGEADHHGSKRRRSASAEAITHPAVKHRVLDETRTSPHPEAASSARRSTLDSGNISPRTQTLDTRLPPTTASAGPNTPVEDDRRSIVELDGVATPGLRPTNLRDLLHYVINESLRVGGRPDSATSVKTVEGERIQVRSRTSKGDAKSKIIAWSVDPMVPETMLVDERDLSKLVSCVFLNALKFTEEGTITLAATVSPKSRFIIINVKDTGPGIPADFLPSIFKPFSREDESLTRATDGLGLGLLVAKGLVRKIGGDLACVRSETSGPNQGTEFEIRIPISPTDAASGPGTPNGGTSTPMTAVPPFSLDDGLSSLNDTRPRRSPPTSSSKPSTTTTSSSSSRRRPSRKSSASSQSTKASTAPHSPTHDRHLSAVHPHTFLVAEDNKINRALLVTMLQKLGYAPSHIHEAYDGHEAVRQMEVDRAPGQEIDVVLMDLWMPGCDGYEASAKILGMEKFRVELEAGEGRLRSKRPTILAVTADVTTSASEMAVKVGMEGLMTKPYRLKDLEKLIVECCPPRQ